MKKRPDFEEKGAEEPDEDRSGAERPGRNTRHRS